METWNSSHCPRPGAGAALVILWRGGLRAESAAFISRGQGKAGRVCLHRDGPVLLPVPALGVGTELNGSSVSADVPDPGHLLSILNDPWRGPYPLLALEEALNTRDSPWCPPGALSLQSGAQQEWGCVVCRDRDRESACPILGS